MIRKLCMECFTKEFPGVRPSQMTWGRECHACHAPTASLATLVKVEES